jgi:hypothetical protein
MGTSVQNVAGTRPSASLTATATRLLLAHGWCNRCLGCRSRQCDTMHGLLIIVMTHLELNRMGRHGMLPVFVVLR